MSITSFSFFFFVCAVLLLYFLVPRRFQWVVLLIASCAFYLSYGAQYILYVLFTSVTVYSATVYMQGITDRQRAWLKGEGKTLEKEEKNRVKAENKKRKKRAMLLVLLANLFVLCVFKYAHFAIEQLNAVLRLLGVQPIADRLRLIAPLGISFYTFQMVGYLVDVYWENVKAERNFFKTLLFCSFFPQITQGPISEFGNLAEQLFAEHAFTYKNYSWGMQRMCWGFFKKMVIADALAPLVSDVFAHYGSYTGITTLIGAFLYSIQIYTDFSGYMDIMCGLCEVMGIRLTENFERPYFSKSVAEYWRRWHISLGVWFKRFIYYPIVLLSYRHLQMEPQSRQGLPGKIREEVRRHAARFGGAGGGLAGHRSLARGKLGLYRLGSGQRPVHHSRPMARSRLRRLPGKAPYQRKLPALARVSDAAHLRPCHLYQGAAGGGYALRGLGTLDAHFHEP